MTIRSRPLCGLLLLMLLAPTLAAGCANAGKDADSNDGARAPIGNEPASATVDSAEQARVDSVLAAIAACPRDGRWHPCSVERRLAQSGLRPVPEADSIGVIPGIPGEASFWRLGRQGLWVVILADSMAARTAMTAMDSLRAAPRQHTTPSWPERATLLRSANLIALLLGGSDRTVERVSDALLAGPPQP
jgi:hypothetical protein